MAGAIYYPPANRTAQWFHGSYRGAGINPDKVLWHTTETTGWPGYGGGASAPHCTYDPVAHEWRQHFRADRSARALRNESGGVETNTDDVLQVEIIAYSDEGLAERVGGTPVSELDDEALQDLADFAHWANEEWGVPLELADDWRPVAAGSLRFSFAEWRAFSGHLGHIHVPENTHWDPGRLDVWTIIDYARGGTVSGQDVWRWFDGLDYVNDDTTSKDHQLARAHQYAFEQPSRVWNRENPTLEIVYGAMLRYIFNAVRPDRSQTPGARIGFLADLDKLAEQNEAILAAVGGEDGQAILDRIEEHHQAVKAQGEQADAKLQELVDRVDEMAEQAEIERAELMQLVRDGQSGELAIDELLDRMAERLSRTGKNES